MSSFKKAQQIKKMTDQFKKIEKESKNTIIESISDYWFIFSFNVLWDIESVEYDSENTTFSKENWFWEEISKDIEKTLKKIISAIKEKRMEITNKYKNPIKPWFRGY